MFKAAVTTAHEVVFSTDLRGLTALARVDAELVPKFLHAVIDELLGREPSFAQFHERLACDAKDILRLKTAWKTYITQALGRALKVEDIVADLTAAGLKGDVVGNAEQGAVGAITARRDELQAALAAGPSCAPYLRDFDWKLNLTLSSDKAASLNVPVLLLSLDVAQPLSDAERAQDPQAGQQRHVVELTQPELAKFVAQLEAMNAAMAGL